MKRFVIFFLLILPLEGLFAQNFTTQCDSLAAMIRHVSTITDSTQKVAAMDTFARAFETTLRQAGSMDFLFDSIPYVGKLTSDDKRVRIYTWNLPLSAEHEEYYGIVQYRLKDGVEKTTVLHPKKDLQVRSEAAELKNGEWLGSLYYQIVQTKSDKQTYYTLIGYEFNNPLFHRKLFDVLTFDGNGSPIFGAPVFDNGQRKLYRVYFEFSDGLPFFVNYLPRKKMLVFQRLQIEALPNGMPGRVPIDVFDGLFFKNGYWQLQKEIDVTPKDFKNK